MEPTCVELDAQTASGDEDMLAEPQKTFGALARHLLLRRLTSSSPMRLTALRSRSCGSKKRRRAFSNVRKKPSDFSATAAPGSGKRF
jgi:hypothetical protein